MGKLNWNGAFWIGAMALLIGVTGCKEEAPKPVAKKVVTAEFNVSEPSLNTYATWSDTGKAVQSARDYLAKNPKAKDADGVAEKAARVTLDAALVVLFSGGDSALKSLGLEFGEGEAAAAASKSVQELMTDRPNISGRDALIGLARALVVDPEKRFDAYVELMKLEGSMGERARVLAMGELAPSLAAAQELLGESVNGDELKALLGKATGLVGGTDLESDPLGGLLKGKKESFVKSLDLRISLPLPSNGEDASTGKPKAISDGPAWKSGPLEVVTISDSGVALGLRPMLSIEEGAVAQGDVSAKRALGGSNFIEKDALLKEEEKGTEETPGTPSGVAQLAKEVESLKGDAGAFYAKGFLGAEQVQGEEPLHTLFQVSGTAPAEVVEAVIQSAVDAGYGSARWATGPNARDYVLVSLGDVVNAKKAASPHFERPLLVHVLENGVDVHPPRKRLEGIAEKQEGENSSALPAGAKPWYAGTKIFKYSVEKGEGEEANLRDTLAFLSEEFGTGNLVLVEANAGVEASRVLAAAKAIGKSGKEALTTVSELSPGLVCGEEGAACPSSIPVLFTGAKVPSSRNLTAEPVKKESAPKPPPAPKAPAPSAKFCNKGDIQKVMKGKKGSFKFCFERQLQMYPDLAGRVVSQFVISEGSTKATSVRIKSSELKNDKVHACLVKTIKKLNFNKPDGGACAVSWPWTFK